MSGSNLKYKSLLIYATYFVILSVFLFNCTLSKNLKEGQSLKSTIKEVKAKSKLLVFTKTNGWRHKSIPIGVNAIKELAIANKWQVDTSEDSLVFNSERLKNYDALIFLNTTGDILGKSEEKAFKDYINKGGNFVGIHSASDTELDNEFYKNLIGAQFKSHPKTQNATVKVNKSHNHPAIKHYQNSFQKIDEWYNFKAPVAKHVNTLLELDESTYSGKRMGI